MGKEDLIEKSFSKIKKLETNKCNYVRGYNLNILDSREVAEKSNFFKIFNLVILAVMYVLSIVVFSFLEKEIASPFFKTISFFIVSLPFAIALISQLLEKEFYTKEKVANSPFVYFDFKNIQYQFIFTMLMLLFSSLISIVTFLPFELLVKLELLDKNSFIDNVMSNTSTAIIYSILLVVISYFSRKHKLQYLCEEKEIKESIKMNNKLQDNIEKEVNQIIDNVEDIKDYMYLETMLSEHRLNIKDKIRKTVVNKICKRYNNDDILSIKKEYLRNDNTQEIVNV